MSSIPSAPMTVSAAENGTIGAKEKTRRRIIVTPVGPLMSRQR